MNESAGSTMEIWYRALFFANHSRSLFRFSCRRNTNISGLKKAVSAIAISRADISLLADAASLNLPPDQYRQLHGIVNGRLQLGAGLDRLSPEPNCGDQAGGYEQGTPRSRSSGMRASIDE